MKRSHGTSSGGLHNPFGMAAKQSQAQQHQPVPSTSNVNTPQQGMSMPFSVPPPPPASAVPQYTNYGYAPQPVSYGMPAPYGYSAPYYPPQPQPMPVHPPPPPPPQHSFSVPPPPPPPPPHAAPQPVIGPSVGPPSKRVRYDQPSAYGGHPPPPALPPLAQRPAFNPGPPPPPPAAPPPQPSGKPPLPPQNLVRPNRNQPPKQQKQQLPSHHATSSHLPANPNLPSKPSAAAAVALPADGSMVDSSKRASSRDSTPAAFPQHQHPQQQQAKRQPSTRGGGAPAGRGRGGSQRGGAAAGLSKRQSKKQKQLNNVSQQQQHHHQQQQQQQQQQHPTPLSPVNSTAPSTKGKEKEKDKPTLTDFRILGLDLEVDGAHVWTWRGENAAEQIKDEKDKEGDRRGALSAQKDGVQPAADSEPAEEVQLISTSSSSSQKSQAQATGESRQSAPPAKTEEKPDTAAEDASQEDKQNPPDAPPEDVTADKQEPLPVPSKHGRDEEDVAVPSRKDSHEPEVTQPVEGRRKKLRAESPAWVPPLSPTAGSVLGKPSPIPEQRENSRLRIYFGAASQHAKSSATCPGPVHHSLKRKHPDLSLSVSSPAKSENDVDGDADENRHKKKQQNKVEEEEEDVDGTPVQLTLPPSPKPDAEAGVETSAPADGSDSSSKAVESHLVPADSAEEKADGHTEDPSSSKDAPHPPSTATADAPPKPVAQPKLSPDRLSISYAKNSRRILVDAACIEQVLIFRTEGRVECTISVEPALLEGDEGADPLRCCKGILVEAFDDDSKEFKLVDADALRKDRDTADPHLLPPFHELFDVSSDSNGQPKLKASEMRIIARLDQANPFSEARWVRSGEADAHALQSAVQASSASKGGSSASAPPSESRWRGKLHVVDPDPPPTFLELAHAWVDGHADGPRKDKMRAFVCTAFGDVNNIVELMLCLIRGGDLPPSRANPTSYRQPQVAELFARATALGAPQPNEQSSLSLATYAMFKLAIDNGVKAGLSQDELHREVCEIVRQLPSGMLHKAMDVQFRAWIAKGHCSGTA